VARQFGLAASTVRAIDLRYLQRWSATRRRDPLLEMGVDEISFGKQMKFITVVSDLETGEPLWFGQDRKQETLDEFFRTQLNATQRKRVAAACVDMWRPFTNSITQWARDCRIIYDKFHILQHANKAIDDDLDAVPVPPAPPGASFPALPPPVRLCAARAICSCVRCGE
jgi:transposase